MLIFVVGILVNVMGYIEELSSSEVRGFSYFVNIANSVLYTSAAAVSLIRFFRLRAENRPLLLRNGRNFREFVLHFMCPLAYLAINLRDAFLSTDLTSHLAVTYSVSIDVIFACYLIILNDVILSLQMVHARVLWLTRNVTFNQQRILDGKWEFRQRVRQANEVFARTLALYHAQIFSVTIYAVTDMYDHTRHWFNSMVAVFNLTCFLLQLHDIAKKGSTLKTQSFEIEEWLLNSDARKSLSKQSLNQMLLVLRFREEWDSLRIGCFVLSVENFFSFFLTCMTWAAVTLQFDLRTVRSLMSVIAESLDLIPQEMGAPGLDVFTCNNRTQV